MIIPQTIGSIYKNVRFKYKGAWHTKLSSKSMEFVSETTMGDLRAQTLVERKVKSKKAKHIKCAIQGPEILKKYPRPLWERYFAHSIKVGTMKKCCNKGCVLCDFTGWVGTIIPGYANYETTQGDRTLQRWCDSGKVKCFRINKRRLIIC